MSLKAQFLIDQYAKDRMLRTSHLNALCDLDEATMALRSSDLGIPATEMRTLCEQGYVSVVGRDFTAPGRPANLYWPTAMGRRVAKTQGRTRLA